MFAVRYKLVYSTVLFGFQVLAKLRTATYKDLRDEFELSFQRPRIFSMDPIIIFVASASHFLSKRLFS